MNRVAVVSIAALSTLAFACAAPVESSSSSSSGDALSIVPPFGSPGRGPVGPIVPRPMPRPLPPCTDVACFDAGAGGAPTCAMTDMVNPDAIVDYQVETCAWLSCGTGAGGDYSSTDYSSTRCAGGTHEFIVELDDLPATGAANVSAGVSAGRNAQTGFDPDNDPFTLHVIVWGHASSGWRQLAELSTPSAPTSPEHAIELSSMFQAGFTGYDLVRISMQAWNTDDYGVQHWDPVIFGLNDPRYVKR